MITAATGGNAFLRRRRRRRRIDKRLLPAINSPVQCSGENQSKVWVIHAEEGSTVESSAEQSSRPTDRPSDSRLKVISSVSSGVHYTTLLDRTASPIIVLMPMPENGSSPSSSSE